MNENTDKESIEYYKSLNWTFQIWRPTPALIDRNGFASHQYLGQNFDALFFSVDPHGWTHDHCEICWKALCENEDVCETSGFVSGGQWVCGSCYNSFINEA